MPLRYSILPGRDKSLQLTGPQQKLQQKSRSLTSSSVSCKNLRQYVDYEVYKTYYVIDISRGAPKFPFGITEVDFDPHVIRPLILFYQ